MLLALGLAVLAPAPARSTVVKKVLSTPWWPPGTEQTLESIGILSRGVAFVTAEMATNHTWTHQMQEELRDVSDVLFAANMTTDDIVECLINVPQGQAEVVRKAFVQALNTTTPTLALTVVEMPGEFQGLPTSLTCTAVQGGPVMHLNGKSATAVKARPSGYDPGFAWISGSAHTCSTGIQALGAEVGDVVRGLGGAGAEDIVDCLAFVDKIEDASVVRSWYSKATSGAALTVVRTNSSRAIHSTRSEENTRSSTEKSAACTLRCVAALHSSPSTEPVSVERKPRRHVIVAGDEDEDEEDYAGDSERSGERSGERRVKAVSVGGFVFVSGVYARNTNASDAIEEMKSTLLSAHSRGNLTLNCMFFAKEQSSIQNIFVGFRQGFNVDAPPPPSRGEYTAPSECDKCPSVVKCVAAMPA